MEEILVYEYKSGKMAAASVVCDDGYCAFEV